MGPHTLTLSGINEETLAKLNIIHQSYLQLKSGSEERAEERKLIGKDEFWSSTHMYRHLVVIKRLVPGEEFLGRGLTPFFSWVCNGRCRQTHDPQYKLCGLYDYCSRGRCRRFIPLKLTNRISQTSWHSLLCRRSQKRPTIPSHSLDSLSIVCQCEAARAKYNTA